MRSKILYIGDPNSVHDRKWISHVNEHERFLVCRKCHIAGLHHETFELWSKANSVTVLGAIEDVSLRRFGRTLRQLLRLRRLLHLHQIRLVHVLYGEPNALWAAFRGFLPARFVITLRGTDILAGISGFFSRRSILARVVAALYRRSFAATSAVTCTSRAQVDRFCALFPAQKHKAQLIRTGTDLEAVLADTREALPGKLQTADYILFPRAIHPLYRHDLAIQAVAALPPNLRERYKFVFLGRDQADVAYLQSLKLATSDVSACFEFLPSLAPQPFYEALKRASLVVMTPSSDGSPVSAAEALLCGSRLILPPLDYDRDLFGRGPYFFERWDPQSLAETMVKALSEDDGDRLNWGIEDVKQHFDRRKEMGKLRAVYASVLARGGSHC